MGSTGVRPIGACERGVVNGTFSRKSFSSKAVLCNATTERGDGLYSAYCPLPSDEARTQNAAFHEKSFSSKAVLCNATTERGDGLYSAYCPLPSDEARTQNAAFHEKSFSSKAVLCNATTERGDGLYSAYCPLPSDEARTQNAAFHEKGKVFATQQINSLKIIFNFGQYEKINDHIDRSTGLLDDRIGGGGTEKRIQGRRDT